MDQQERGKVIDFTAKLRERNLKNGSGQKLDLYKVLMQLVTGKELISARQVFLFFSRTLYRLTGTRVFEVDSDVVLSVIERAENGREEFREAEMRQFVKSEKGVELLQIKHEIGSIITDINDRLYAGELFTILIGILRSQNARDRLG